MITKTNKSRHNPINSKMLGRVLSGFHIKLYRSQTMIKNRAMKCSADSFRKHEALTKEAYKNATIKFRMLSSLFIVLGLPLCTFLNPVYAQDNTPPQIAGQASSLSGLFSIIWGDSKDGKSSMIYTLTDANGQRTLLQLDETVSRKLGGVLQFNGKYVSVQGTWATPSHTGAAPDLTQSPPAVINVISISLTPSPGSKAPTINGVTALGGLAGHILGSPLCANSLILPLNRMIARIFWGCMATQSPD